MLKAVYAMQGIELLTVMLFLMSAAALGACFNALFTAHHYISDGTYDTRFDSSYWMRIGLGVISGLLMAELIPVDELLQSEDQSKIKAVDLGKPMLALLGGFSANLVYTVLQRVVQTIQSLFQPAPVEARDAAERDMRSRIDQQVARSRMDSAGTLLTLQDAIAKGTDKDQLAAIVSRALDTLVPGSRAAQEKAGEGGGS